VQTTLPQQVAAWMIHESCVIVISALQHVLGGLPIQFDSRRFPQATSVSPEFSSSPEFGFPLQHWTNIMDDGYWMVTFIKAYFKETQI
jgi:hypothetical protein